MGRWTLILLSALCHISGSVSLPACTQTLVTTCPENSVSGPKQSHNPCRAHCGSWADTVHVVEVLCSNFSFLDS